MNAYLKKLFIIKIIVKVSYHPTIIIPNTNIYFVFSILIPTSKGEIYIRNDELAFILASVRNNGKYVMHLYPV